MNEVKFILSTLLDCLIAVYITFFVKVKAEGEPERLKDSF